jgi:hypothetical protein
MVMKKPGILFSTISVVTTFKLLKNIIFIFNRQSEIVSKRHDLW